MKIRRRHGFLTSTIALGAILATQQATAQLESTGAEVSPVLSCFYECKPGPEIQGAETYRQITTLPIANNGRFAQTVDVNFIDGNGKVIATTDVSLERRDVDELAVCNTIESITGSKPPRAGLVQIANFDAFVQQRPSGVYSWIKNVSGKFFRTRPEPFDGRVTGIAKSECTYVASLEVNDPDTIEAESGQAPSGPPILVEDTDDTPPGARADLLPQPAASGSLCRLQPGNQLEIEIRNQGAAPSAPTTTEVRFLSGPGGNAVIPTPWLAPGASSTTTVPIPFGCYQPNCHFEIEADRGDVEAESNEVNNVAADSCLG